jgi:hypothetical protein
VFTKRAESEEQMSQPTETFAGFAYPRYLGSISNKPLRERLAEYKANKMRHDGAYRAYTSGYYQDKPGPVGPNHGRMFYHDSDFAPGLRWTWCDKVEGVGRSLRHTGWFTDPEDQGEKLRGLVFRLPRGRGFLAGYTLHNRAKNEDLAQNMAGSFEYAIYEDELGAAYAADDLAKDAAEEEIEYRETHKDEYDHDAA